MGTVDQGNSLLVEFCTTSSCNDYATINGDIVATAVGSGFLDNGTKSAFVELSDITPGTDDATFSEIKLITINIALEFVPQAVPEPLSLAVLGTGLFALGMIRRRRQGNTTLTTG